MSTNLTTASSSGPFEESVYPLTVNVIPEVKGQLSITAFTFTVKNAGDEVKLSKIKLALPASDTDSITNVVLPECVGDILPVAGQTAIWNIEQSTITDGEFTANPHVTGTLVPFDKDKSFSFTLNNVALSTIEGQAQVSVTLVLESGEEVKKEITITKALDKGVWATLVAEPTSIPPRTKCKLTWNGSGVNKFVLTSSTGFRVESDHPDSDVELPLKDTTYTLDAYGVNIRLQTQVVVIVQNPLLTQFTVTPAVIDAGAMVELAWKTEYANAVRLNCTDKTLIPHDTKVSAPFENYLIGPVTKPVQLTITVLAGALEGNTLHSHIAINPPEIKAFNITALPLEYNKECTFKLDWDLKNAGDFEITEDNGHTQPTKLHIPSHAKEFFVKPVYPKTIYTIKATEIKAITN
jgi:hypothetical protein